MLLRDHANDKATYRLKHNIGEHWCTGPDGSRDGYHPARPRR